MASCKAVVGDRYKEAGKDPCDSKYNTEISSYCDEKCSTQNKS